MFPGYIYTIILQCNSYISVSIKLVCSLDELISFSVFPIPKNHLFLFDCNNIKPLGYQVAHAVFLWIVACVMAPLVWLFSVNLFVLFLGTGFQLEDDQYSYAIQILSVQPH